MPTVVLHLDFHLPLRLRKFGFFDIGQGRDYFDGEESRAALVRFAEGFALPATALMLRLVRRHRGRFRVSLSVSGMLLEQLEKGQKPLLESFRRLTDTGFAEFVCGTSHHSLASLFSEAEFRRQIALHRRMIRSRFGQAPKVFRNTDGIFDDAVARIARSMGFRVILAGGARDRDTGEPCTPWRYGTLTVLPRHGRLSDDMVRQEPGAFAVQLAEGFGGDEVISLVTDCGRFGEADPGGPALIRFLETVPGLLLRRRNWHFCTPSEAAALWAQAPAVRPFPPGTGREACLANHLQRDAADTLFAMEGRVRRSGSRRLLNTWRRLQASDYLDRMSTKGLSEGVPGGNGADFASPYDTYIHTMNILKDLSGRVEGRSGVRP
ncbi:MAG: polysaccharide deacetylase family protein [Syntrophaceae bacterium]|nr:polysaccharide deacetylase family protein [Syntrophaceae bacterium]